MALVLIDGLEDGTTIYLYNTTPNNPVAARNGNGYTLGASNYVIFGSPQLVAALGWTVGAAVKATVLSATANMLVAFMGDNGIIQGSIILNTDGSLSFRRGTSGTILSTTAAGVIQVNSWAYVEVQYLYSTVNSGTVVIRVNNTVVLTLTNVNTSSTSPSTNITQIYYGYPGSTAQQMVLDDVYICEGTTPDPFLGDITVETLYPNGNGNRNVWLGSDGDNVNNYLLVNEVGAPNTGTYTKDSVSGDGDVYALDNLKTVAGQVQGVCHVAFANKSDAGPAQFRIVNHGTADTKSAALSPATSSDGWTYALAQNPDTGTAWTVATVNALQSGVEIV